MFPLATYFLAYTMDCLASVVMKAGHFEFQAAIIRGILCVSLPNWTSAFPCPTCFSFLVCSISLKGVLVFLFP